MRSKQQRAMLLMMLCASLWSLAGLLIKGIPWHAFSIAGLRSLIASLVVVVYVRASGHAFVLNRRSLISALFVSGTFLCFVGANKLTTSANAIVLQFTTPVYILIYQSLIRRQRVQRLDLITVLTTLVGISLFFLDQLTPGHLLGNLIALLSGVMMAGTFVSTGEASENECMSGIFFGHLLTAVIGIPFMWMTPTPITGQAMTYILLLGVAQLGVPYVLYGIAVRHCPPLACSLLAAIEPLLNPLIVFIVYREAPGLFALLGGAIVIGTLTAWCVLSLRKASAVATQERLAQ